MNILIDVSYLFMHRGINRKTAFMHMPCCGMSLVPKYHFHISGFLVHDTCIAGTAFAVLLAGAFALACTAEMAGSRISACDTGKSRAVHVYVLGMDVCVMAMHFIAMMACMSFNVWIVMSVLVGKVVGRMSGRVSGRGTGAVACEVCK